jgi:hypothetical protein
MWSGSTVSPGWDRTMYRAGSEIDEQWCIAPALFKGKWTVYQYMICEDRSTLWKCVYELICTTCYTGNYNYC